MSLAPDLVAPVYDELMRSLIGLWLRRLNHARRVEGEGEFFESAFHTAWLGLMDEHRAWLDTHDRQVPPHFRDELIDFIRNYV